MQHKRANNLFPSLSTYAKMINALLALGTCLEQGVKGT